MIPIKALTLKQPWAYAVTRLGKNVENRSWTTRHRGMLAIHAGSGWAGNEAQSAVAFSARCGYGDVQPARRQKAAIVAVVDLVDVCGVGLDGRGCYCGPWAMERQWHWRLANPRALAVPVPCKGRLGLWDLPTDVEAAVLGQIEVTS